MSAPERPVDALGPERVLAFSDGVVAIALTLLVLPLADLVPEAVARGESGAEIVLGNLGPIGSFLLSFVIVGRLWAAHHRVFDGAPHVTRTLVTWNLAWLLTVVVIPFTGELVGATPSGDVFVLRFYAATLAASSLLLSIMAVMVARTRAPGARRGRPVTTTLLVVVLVVTVVAPGVGYYAFLLLLVDPLVDRVLSLRTRRRERAGRGDAAR